METIPSRVPYLHAEQGRVSSWRDRLGSNAFKVGVCWQGSTQNQHRAKSFPLQALVRLSRIPNVRLISLQKFQGTDRLDALADQGVAETLGDGFDPGPDKFVDTAAIMETLDLIITCDTSIAHLAGALARPTWVALKYVPDWRWLLERSDSPWYPTLRLFRQSSDGRWDDVFDSMYDAMVAGLT
jgi:hypothetical protein